MNRSAAGVSYYPFQMIQRMVLSRPRELYYIGGNDILPAPLGAEEAYVSVGWGTEQDKDAKATVLSTI